MLIHDWTRVPAGLFHHFHQDWSIEIARALNRGKLPVGYSALVEQRVNGPEPDVIAVETPMAARDGNGTTALLAPPQTRIVQRLKDDATRYSEKANRIVIRQGFGEVVAVIEIVSPGNKGSREACRSFVEKSIAFLRHGIHLLVIDLFPPSKRDPQGIHQAIIEEFCSEEFRLPPETPLTLVSYQAGDDPTAYVETVAVGQPLIDMPLFLTPKLHVPAPLNATYEASWSVCPDLIRDLLTKPPNDA